MAIFSDSDLIGTNLDYMDIGDTLLNGGNVRHKKLLQSKTPDLFNFRESDKNYIDTDTYGINSISELPLTEGVIKGGVIIIIGNVINQNQIGVALDSAIYPYGHDVFNFSNYYDNSTFETTSEI